MKWVRWLMIECFIFLGWFLFATSCTKTKFLSVSILTGGNSWIIYRALQASRISRFTEERNFLDQKRPLFSLLMSSSVRLKLKTTWMITFIISHNEHSCPSCDVIHSDRCVPARDVRLLPIRSLPIRTPAGTPPPSSPSPSPVAYVQTGSTSALAPFSSLLYFAPPTPHCVS